MKKNVLLAATLALAVAAPAWSQSTARAATIVDASAALESAARVAAPAVVSIFTTSFAPGQGRLTRAADLVATERGAGSGVIVDPDGFIITNAHVVNGAHQLAVQLPSPAGGQSILGRRSRTVKGTVVGIDLETDLALIRVEEKGLPALQFADSDTLRAGQLVLALGNPMGLESSVSMGVVSAVARQLSADSPMIYVQTDAAINPGSSGGALIDTKGRLAGINTLIVSQAGGNEGLGFAAPSNIVKAVYGQLRAHGRVRRGDIGVRAQTIRRRLRRRSRSRARGGDPRRCASRQSRAAGGSSARRHRAGPRWQADGERPAVARRALPPFCWRHRDARRPSRRDENILAGGDDRTTRLVVRCRGRRSA